MPWNIVVMGMGEPLLNYDNTVAALRVLMDTRGFAVSARKLTLSTVGILPALEKLMLEPLRPNLAISLHAPNAGLRRELMPIEERYPLAEVIAAAQRYPIPRAAASPMSTCC
jgi:23S rRNA (adenine2503-C2)-methyltransferase